MTENIENQSEETNVEKPKKDRSKSKKQVRKEDTTTAQEPTPKDLETIGTIIPEEGSVKSLHISELSQEDIDAIANAEVPKEYSHLDELLEPTPTTQEPPKQKTYGQIMKRKTTSQAMSEAVLYRRTGRKPQKPNK